MGLFLNDKKVGVYDSAKNAYFKVDSSGRLSDSVAPPWASSSSTAANNSSASKANEGSVAKAAEDQENEQTPWVSYAVGGGVAGLLLLAGLVFRK